MNRRPTDYESVALPTAPFQLVSDQLHITFSIIAIVLDFCNSFFEKMLCLRKKIDTMDELLEANKDANFYYLTTKTKRLYTDTKFQDGDFIVFGPETRGLPEKYVKDHNALTIPMREGQRSLNLSNSVAIVAYEAIRQNGL